MRRNSSSDTLPPGKCQPGDATQVEPVLKQELFLPIYGNVELYPEEVAVIDHPAVQRLRRVKQLGLAHMVFPGATHTRFEHSIGAVHVAQLIIDHVNKNQRIREDGAKQWKREGINDATSRFVRLAALLHDVGHLPLGHTLEDELNHLRAHDGPERLRRVADVPYPNYEIRQTLKSAEEKANGGAVVVPLEQRLTDNNAPAARQEEAKSNEAVIALQKPGNDGTLRALINRLYSQHAEALGLADDKPFEILSHIVCKPPNVVPEKQEWEARAKKLTGFIPLEVCRDIVGNTICADFLDYIYRDWYHLGKPLYCDMRLYQYMEVRRQTQSSSRVARPQFVINVGPSQRIRHDALTDILELLNARYKLAETVLFHRTKLALTGLLDRCLLEIADLYAQVGSGNEKFKESTEALLLDTSDDGIPGILRKLAAGGDSESRRRIEEAVNQENVALQEAIAPGLQRSLTEGVSHGRLAAQRQHAMLLIEKLRDREVYTLAFKLRMADFTGPHTPENNRVRQLLEIYSDPQNRLDYLRKMEAACGFAPGTLIMNCPPDAGMNAKVAKVNLYIEDDVTPFDEYEKRGQPNLTCGALIAQVNRFYELWAASVYVDRQTWDALSEGERKNLRSVLKEFLFQMEPGKDPYISRAQMQPSLDALQRRASRAGSVDPREETYRGTFFPSGMPFDQPSGK
jgi:HD superfamily phosphohydrolase